MSISSLWLNRGYSHKTQRLTRTCYTTRRGRHLWTAYGWQKLGRKYLRMYHAVMYQRDMAPTLPANERKVKIWVLFDPPMLEWLREIAKRDGVSIASRVRDAVVLLMAEEKAR